MSAKFGLSTPREMILDSVMSIFELETERKKTLEEKATNLIGFVGIILSLISGFGLTYVKVPELKRATCEYLRQISTLISFGLVYVSLFASMVFALKALQIKQYTYVPNAFNLIGLYENSTVDIVCQALYDEYALAIKENTVENDKKAMYIKKSTYCLFVAFIFLAIHVILFISLGR